MPKGQPDHFYRLAKKEGFAARSVFKLQELDRKYRLIRSGDQVLDLGAAPGSWLQYICEKVGERGLVVGVDIAPLKIATPSNGRFLLRDALECETSELASICERYDVVLSDLAPKTTGNRTGDHTRSIELCEKALSLAGSLLKPGGHFVCKMYQGEDSGVFLKSMRDHFADAKTHKPTSSRSESRELFFIGLTLL